MAQNDAGQVIALQTRPETLPFPFSIASLSSGQHEPVETSVVDRARGHTVNHLDVGQRCPPAS